MISRVGTAWPGFKSRPLWSKNDNLSLLLCIEIQWQTHKRYINSDKLEYFFAYFFRIALSAATDQAVINQDGFYIAPGIKFQKIYIRDSNSTVVADAIVHGVSKSSTDWGSNKNFGFSKLIWFKLCRDVLNRSCIGHIYVGKFYNYNYINWFPKAILKFLVNFQEFNLIVNFCFKSGWKRP